MCNCYGNKTVGFEDKAFDNSSSNTTDDLQGETHMVLPQPKSSIV